MLSKYRLGRGSGFGTSFSLAGGFYKLGEDPRGGWVFKGENGEITVVASGF